MKLLSRKLTPVLMAIIGILFFATQSMAGGELVLVEKMIVILSETNVETAALIEMKSALNTALVTYKGTITDAAAVSTYQQAHEISQILFGIPGSEALIAAIPKLNEMEIELNDVLARGPIEPASEGKIAAGILDSKKIVTLDDLTHQNLKVWAKEFKEQLIQDENLTLQKRFEEIQLGRNKISENMEALEKFKDDLFWTKEDAGLKKHLIENILPSWMPDQVYDALGVLKLHTDINEIKTKMNLAQTQIKLHEMSGDKAVLENTQACKAIVESDSAIYEAMKNADKKIQDALANAEEIQAILEYLITPKGPRVLFLERQTHFGSISDLVPGYVSENEAYGVAAQKSLANLFTTLKTLKPNFFENRPLKETNLDLAYLTTRMSKSAFVNKAAASKDALNILISNLQSEQAVLRQSIDQFIAFVRQEFQLRS